MTKMKHVRIWAAPLLLLLLLSLAWIIPSNPELLKSAISGQLPLELELDGWYGKKEQESEKERLLLADDTKFSKARYIRLDDRSGMWVSVSIVYSGQDLNNSIHRPERCLPSQGHLNLRVSDHSINLDNGHVLTYRRIDSSTPAQEKGGESIQHIHYYFFIGHDRVCHDHYFRTFYDMWDRVVKGRTQEWAYLQIGSFWGGGTGIPKEQAEAALDEIIKRLSERQIDWQRIKD